MIPTQERDCKLPVKGFGLMVGRSPQSSGSPLLEGEKQQVLCTGKSCLWKSGSDRMKICSSFMFSASKGSLSALKRPQSRLFHIYPCHLLPGSKMNPPGFCKFEPIDKENVGAPEFLLRSSGSNSNSEVGFTGRSSASWNQATIPIS